MFAHHVLGPGAVELGDGRVPEEKVSFVVLEDDEVWDLVDHRPEQGSLCTQVVLCLGQRLRHAIRLGELDPQCVILSL